MDVQMEMLVDGIAVFDEERRLIFLFRDLLKKLRLARNFLGLGVKPHHFASASGLLLLHPTAPSVPAATHPYLD